MPIDDELNKLLSNTERFLKQQQELYGELFILQKNEPQNEEVIPISCPRSLWWPNPRQIFLEML